MFERASQKQGLEQAVIRGQQNSGPKKSSKEEKLELERLLRHGAYDLFKDGEADSKKFNEEDIESILAARSTKIEHENKSSANLMSTASFVPASAGTGAEVDYNDPDFWAKLMPAAVACPQPDAYVKEEEEYVNGRRRKTVERLGFDGSVLAGSKIGGDSGGSGNDSGSGYESGGHGQRRHDRLSARLKGDNFSGPQWGVGDLKAAKKRLLDLGYGRWKEIHKAVVIKGATEADIQHFGFEFLKAVASISHADQHQIELIAKASNGDQGKGSLHMSKERMEEACALKSEKSSREYFRKLLQLALLTAAVKKGDSQDFGLKDFAPSLPMAGWTGKHDANLMLSIYTHGIDNAGRNSQKSAL